MKHFGVQWQSYYLVRLAVEIGKRTNWDRRRCLTAVTDLVRATLRAVNVTEWYDWRQGPGRLREILRSAIKDFERDPRHKHLLDHIYRADRSHLSAS